MIQKPRYTNYLPYDLGKRTEKEKALNVIKSVVHELSITLHALLEEIVISDKIELVGCTAMKSNEMV